MSEFRVEKDSMGEVRVPADAYWGAQTQRAVENFPVSGQRFPRRFLEALGLIKWAAAKANQELGLLDARRADAITAAAEEVIAGTLDDHFPVDIFQTGSGTSTNMNANEVIANRADELLGEARGSKAVHPNDHVNNGQSSNDVIPTAIHVSALLAIRDDLEPALVRARGFARGQGGAVRRDAQGRPDAPDGRHADHARSGVRRLRAADRERDPGPRLCADPARGAGARRHRGRNGDQRGRAVRRHARSPRSPSAPASTCARRPTTSRRRVRRTRASSHPGSCDGSRCR